MLTPFQSCFKTFFICTFNASKVRLLLVTYYLNGGLHAVSIGKPSEAERMSNFWTIRLLKTEFRFSAHPY